MPAAVAHCQYCLLPNKRRVAPIAAARADEALRPSRGHQRRVAFRFRPVPRHELRHRQALLKLHLVDRHFAPQQDASILRPLLAHHVSRLRLGAYQVLLWHIGQLAEAEGLHRRFRLTTPTAREISLVTFALLLCKGSCPPLTSTASHGKRQAPVSLQEARLQVHVNILRKVRTGKKRTPSHRELCPRRARVPRPRSSPESRGPV